jgi:hypothetical protein
VKSVDQSGRAGFTGRLRQSWWAVPVLIAVASRIWGTGLVYAFGAGSWTGFLHPPAVGPATTWDGAWYLSIARTGYHAAPLLGADPMGYHDFAFWPAWPTVLAPLLRMVPDAWADMTASLAANVIAIAGLVLWARVLEPAFGRREARWAIAFVAFAPSSFVLSMAYSEPLFLLVGAAFFLSRTGSLRRPVLAAIAQATRVTGFALGATAIPALFRARGRDRRAWLTLIAPLLVFAGWWVFLAVLTGSPGGFLEGTPNWLHVTGQQSGPFSFQPDIARDGRYGRPIVIWAVFTSCVVLGSLLLFRRRLPEFGWFAVAALVPTLLLASWQSMPRHALVAVPAVAAFVERVPVRLRWALLVLSALAEIVVTESMVGIRLISP